MQDFHKLQVWRKAYDLTLAVYRASTSFPAAERFELTSQARRAAASITANIAEGCGRGGGADFRRFLQIALGSANELEVHLLLARDLGFLQAEAFTQWFERTVELQRMLGPLIERVAARRRATSQLADAPLD